MDGDDDVAKSMIRMYGGRAEMVALERVNKFRRDGDIQSYERWLRITSRIQAISRQIKS